MGRVPQSRIEVVNKGSVRPDGRFVLYWMIANRRPSWNFSLDRALEWSVELAKPLVVLEPLRCGYRWASDRLHRFVLDGMADNARAFENTDILYYPYLEPKPGSGKGLLRAFAAKAAAVITDDYPSFFLPRAIEAAARQISVRFERVDSNGLFPMRSVDRVYPTAYAFRRFLQKTLPEHLSESPRSRVGLDLPARASLPREIRKRWPQASANILQGKGSEMSSIPIDHEVAPAPFRGGSQAARQKLRSFIKRLPEYGDARNHPDDDATSGLSPYLHFGHISTHEIFAALSRHEGWSSNRLKRAATGGRSGWWGLSSSAESFLDELVTWRELGFNMAWQREDSEQYGSLPDWAQATLAKHARDPRRYEYSLAEFEEARTHDPLWNSAQTQLLREGRLHNYLRMLWGKKILEWSSTPQDALDVMIELNNKYAVDGRDPNSASGIFWVLGRYDRAWGPERPIFGTVRYMSSDNTARKLRLRKYLERYSAENPPLFNRT